MKFITATIVTLFCSAAAVTAAPVLQAGSPYLVPRAAAEDVYGHMEEIKSIIAKKREYPAGSEELIELDRRGTDTLGNLITAFYNSGILGDIWNTFQTDTELKDALYAAGSEVVSAVFNIIVSWLTGGSSSGSTTGSDSTTTLLSTQAIGTASATTSTSSAGGILGFIGGLFGGDSSTSAATTTTSVKTTAAATATTTASGSGVVGLIEGLYGASSTYASAAATNVATTAAATADAAASGDALASLAAIYTKRATSTDEEMLSKRDALALITTVVDFLKSSGVITELLNWFANNGELLLSSVFGINIDTSATQTLVSAGASATKSGSATTGAANILSELLGGVAASGSAATTGTAKATTTGTVKATTAATTAGAANVLSELLGGVAASGAAATTAKTTSAAGLTTAAAITSVALPTSNDVNVLNSLDALYGGATTLVRRMVM